VLAAPAQFRLCGQRHFHDRRGIGEHPVAEGADGGFHARRQLLQAVAQHLVIIAPQRIAGDIRRVWVIQNRVRVGGGRRKIIQSRADDALRAGDQFCGPGALTAMRGHIIHLAMKAFIQPLLQVVFRARQIAVGNADRGKAKLAPPEFDALRKRV